MKYPPYYSVLLADWTTQSEHCGDTHENLLEMLLQIFELQVHKT